MCYPNILLPLSPTWIIFTPDSLQWHNETFGRPGRQSQGACAPPSRWKFECYQKQHLRLVSFWTSLSSSDWRLRAQAHHTNDLPAFIS